MSGAISVTGMSTASKWLHGFKIEVWQDEAMTQFVGKKMNIPKWVAESYANLQQEICTLNGVVAGQQYWVRAASITPVTGHEEWSPLVLMTAVEDSGGIGSGLCFTPYDFGAIGDGIADDRLPLQAALDAARDNYPHCVTIPPRMKCLIGYTVQHDFEGVIDPTTHAQIVGYNGWGTAPSVRIASGVTLNILGELIFDRVAWWGGPGEGNPPSLIENANSFSGGWATHTASFSTITTNGGGIEDHDILVRGPGKVKFIGSDGVSNIGEYPGFYTAVRFQQCKNCRVENLTIENAAGASIIIGWSRECAVKDVSFESEAGVFIDGGSYKSPWQGFILGDNNDDCLYADNLFIGRISGVTEYSCRGTIKSRNRHLGDADHVVGLLSDIAATFVIDEWFGYYFQDDGWVFPLQDPAGKISDTIITANEYRGCWCGILLQGGFWGGPTGPDSGYQVYGNKCTDGFIGIAFGGLRYGSIEGNICRHNQADGISYGTYFEQFDCNNVQCVLNIPTDNGLGNGVMAPHYAGEDIHINTDLLRIFLWNPLEDSLSSMPLRGLTLQAQTGSVSATTLFNSNSSGLYRLSGYIFTTTAGTAGTATLTITYGNGSSSETITAPALNLASLNNPVAIDTVLYLPAGESMGYSVTVTGATGSPQYSVALSVEKAA